MTAHWNSRDFRGVYGNWLQLKHDHNGDFGYPDTLTFDRLHATYCRNGIAHAAVEKIVGKTWQDIPTLYYGLDDGELSRRESEVNEHLLKIRFWNCLSDADRRSLVGGYAGLIFRFADDKKMEDPVDSVPGGVEGLVEIIPAWAGQLTVSEFYSDPNEMQYGQPKLFNFNESGIASGNRHQPRSFVVHPDRVFVWSQSGSVHDISSLSSGYNDLLTIEKVIGAGGQGFWKNSKSAPILEIDKDAQLSQFAAALGVPVDEVADLMEKQVEGYSKGFDTSLLLHGITAKTLPVSLPQPEEFFSIAVQSFAASMCMPVKILLGMQTGERASSEDAIEWAQTCQSRRNNQTIPNISGVIDRLRKYRILSDENWILQWPDLTENSPEQKIERAAKMAEINVKNVNTGSNELIFTPNEIRETVGLPAREELESDVYDQEPDDE